MTETIRPARPEDLEALRRLARRAYHETFVEDFALPYPAADLEAFYAAAYGPAAVAAWLSGPDRIRVLEAGSGELLGYSQTGPNSLPWDGARPDDLELKRLYLARAAQGRGLGTRLLADALEPLAGRRVLIGVWSGNARALAIYARRGFRPVGGYRFQVGTWFDDELILLRDAERGPDRDRADGNAAGPAGP